MSPRPDTSLRKGRYDLYSAIGRGGTATVYLARLVGPQGFSRVVAVKRLHPTLTHDPEFVARFLDEARLAAGIRHPNVVPTIDVVESEGEILLVMEHVEGESLSRLLSACIERGIRVPPPVASAIVADALAGLHAAHESVGANGRRRALVHRDVSPQNVLVGVDGHARILDFGIAKHLDRETRTNLDCVLGKIGYMAPEYRAGARIDRRADIFAAGVVLWEALMTRRLSRSEADVDQPVPAPSTEIPDLDARVDAVVQRALERDPSRRFATAEDMARALEAALSPARPREVGAWVADLAAKSLAERRAEISRAPDAPVTLTMIATSAGARTSKGRSSGLKALAVVGACLAAVALVAGTARGLKRSAATAEMSRAETPPEPSAKMEADAISELPPAPVVLDADAGPTIAPRAPRSGPRSLATPSARPKNCNPPFTLDEAGRKHFRRECM